MIIIAAYAEPGDVFCLMMIPALDHGGRPGPVWGPSDSLPAGGTVTWPVSDVICTVIVPFPVTGWCTR